jgi:alkylated DNA repair dioxygenase AlkB
LIKKEAITGYEDLKIDLYQDARIEEKKDLWFESCLRDLNWETGFIKIFGKTHQIPRLQAWYADNEIEYTYSGEKLQRHNWNNLLLDIKERIETVTSFEFNSVLANLYRDGMIQWGFTLMTKKNLAIIL